MKNLSVIFLICIAIVGCKKPCTQSIIIHNGAEGLAKFWDCQNEAALEAWIDDMASKVKLCSNLPVALQEDLTAGPIGSFICPLLLKEAQKLISSQVPSEALCDPNKVGAGAVAALSLACQAIPF